jgi:LysM repeat protein
MRRQLLAFVGLNVIMALGAALVAMLLWTATHPETMQVPTFTPVALVVTATPPPNVTVVTATPAPRPEVTAALPQTHTVHPDENCSTIAEAYGVPLEALLAANGLDETCLIYPGDELVIPSGEPLPRQGVVVYTVQPGDSVFGIAARFGLRPESIFWANQEALPDVHELEVGQQLYILPVDGVLHTASGEETVGEIAARYGVEPEAIIESAYNDLTDAIAETRLRAGEQIVVPGGQGEAPEDLFPQMMPRTPTPDETAEAGLSGGR